jgi:hypothetical protein
MHYSIPKHINTIVLTQPSQIESIRHRMSQIKPLFANSMLHSKNTAFTTMILLLYLAVSASCSPCNSIIIARCSIYDIINVYSLVDCGCLLCNPGYSVSLDYLSCCDSSTMDPNCLSCDASFNCQACVSQYVLDSSNSNTCLSCSNLITNCLTCQYITAY